MTWRADFTAGYEARMALQPKFAEVETPFAVERALVGEHPAIVKLRALIERVAPTEVTVLITGESGTGKEVVAQAIHTLSPRSASAVRAGELRGDSARPARIRDVRA